MARITLDVIMATGFDLPSDAVDLDKACPLLEDMHFLMAETFRWASALLLKCLYTDLWQSYFSQIDTM